MNNDISASANRQRFVYEGFLLPFILITSLFFLWALHMVCLDVLNKHFQELLNMSKANLHSCNCLLRGYFFMAIPAGLIMQKVGYKRGIIFGLLVFASGAFLMLPATLIQTFGSFLLCLFVIACGMTCLETAANPYTTVLGLRNQEKGDQLFQSFNGLGWIAGPLVGEYLSFQARKRKQICNNCSSLHAHRDAGANSGNIVLESQISELKDDPHGPAY
jgi:FHS family L-fucose permease-like MFS transporter